MNKINYRTAKKTIQNHAFKYSNDFFKFLKVIFSNYTEIDLTIGELL